MKDGLDAIEHYIKAGNISILLNRTVDAALVREIQPDLVVWATGAIQNIPDIQGLDSQYTMTSLEYFQEEKEIRGPRVLVIGAGRVGELHRARAVHN